MTCRIINADVFEGLRRLPDGSVHVCVTSPPYWGLRSYLPADHPDKGKELGSEPTLDCLGWATGENHRCGVCYICRMTAVFGAVWRVLRDDGTLWLNIGSGYAANRTYQVTDNKHVDVGNSGGMRVPTGLKPKDELMVPARLVLSLQAAGWYLRSQIPWIKRNSKPESVEDRPATSVEYVYLLTKSPRYYFDMEAVRRPDRGTDHARAKLNGQPSLAPPGQSPHAGIRTEGGRNGKGRNLRNGDWWFDSWQGLYEEDDELLGFVVNPVAYRGAHFACYPPELIRPMVRAGTSERGCCPTCGALWVREVERTAMVVAEGPKGRVTRTQCSGTVVEPPTCRTICWKPGCVCGFDEDGPEDPVPCTVLDCFGGSGTTGAVAVEEGREAVLIELSADYCKLIEQRLSRVVRQEVLL